MNRTILIIITGTLLVFWFLSYQNKLYYTWVINHTMNSFEACMIFEREGEHKMRHFESGKIEIRQGKGEKHCKEYARDKNSYSPYPWWKALVLINPNK